MSKYALGIHAWTLNIALNLWRGGGQFNKIKLILINIWLIRGDILDFFNK
jgi:hypothetical protein